MEMMTPEAESTKHDQKIKNLSALVILLIGLFAGSLFVDVAQLISGSGFSQSAAKKYSVLESENKTWVSYDEPKVTLQVVTDEDCVECDPSEALVWMRRIIPTLEAVNVPSDSAAGRALIERFQLIGLPSFVFSSSVTSSDFYTQAESLFTEDNGLYFFDMAKIGLPIGRYLTLPKVDATSLKIGDDNAKVKIVEFSDFQCTYCKLFQSVIKNVLDQYGDKVQFVYKHLPLSFNDQAENAALAAECANEQGKFSVYADTLYDKQDEWSRTTGTQRFKNYAWQLRLDGRQFTQCLDTKKYAEKIAADRDEALELSVTGTPGTFVNNTFFGGAVDEATIKQAIEAELAKEN